MLSIKYVHIIIILIIIVIIILFVSSLFPHILHFADSIIFVLLLLFWCFFKNCVHLFKSYKRKFSHVRLRSQGTLAYQNSRFFLAPRRLGRFARRDVCASAAVGSFSNNDGDGSENVKKNNGLIKQNNIVDFSTASARLQRENA